MDTSKVSFGEMVAGVSGGALFIFMFLPWYGGKATVGVPGVGSVSGGSVSAWEAFSFIDLLLFVVVVVVVGLTVARAMDAMPKGIDSPGTIVTVAGAVAVLLVLFRLIATPDADLSGTGFEFDLTRKIGIYLGLIAAGGIAFGGYTAMSEQASSTRR